MGTHIKRGNKTTVELSPGLMARAKAVARREQITFRQLLEEGLNDVIRKRKIKERPFELRFVSFGGEGISPDFENWTQIRDAVYPEGSTG